MQNLKNSKFSKFSNFEKTWSRWSKMKIFVVGGHWACPKSNLANFRPAGPCLRRPLWAKNLAFSRVLRIFTYLTRKTAFQVYANVIYAQRRASCACTDAPALRPKGVLMLQIPFFVPLGRFLGPCRRPFTLRASPGVPSTCCTAALNTL